MPIGPALLVGCRSTSSASVSRLRLSCVGLAAPPDGFDRVLQIVPGITGIAAATTAACVSWRMARPRTGGRRAAAAVFGVWFGIARALLLAGVPVVLAYGIDAGVVHLLPVLDETTRAS